MSTEVRRPVESRQAAVVIEKSPENTKEQSSSTETGPLDESMVSSACSLNTSSFVTASDFDEQQLSFEACVEGDEESSFETCQECDEELEKFSLTI